jgi:DNA repair photolyase
VREIQCSTLLHVLNFGSSSEYTVNFYRGCSHGCVYCYAPSLVHDEREWGTYVDVKVNAPIVLERELRHAQKAVVFISSASDPYQPVEAKYEITRRCLELLLKFDFPILILTRSPLVLRDVDLLKKFRWARVGFSVSTVSNRFYEPSVPLLRGRLEALKKLHDQGITTWVSLAPILPRLILTDLDWLFKELNRVGVSAVSVGLLRFAGYEESKRMFELKTGFVSSEVVAGGNSVLKEILNLASHYGLDTSGRPLSWKEDNTQPTLDAFVKLNPIPDS